ncbi:TPA: hypothetical protein I8235_001550 [Kluyvera intermedia]|nr:hypothetical protein [Kluyvera intermedia]
MTIFGIISHTPFWVWILFFFLILRGYAALLAREMNISQLFILPLLFLIWGVWGLKEAFNFNVASLMGMSIGLAFGILAGWQLWKNQPRLKNKPHSEKIIRAGTPLTLIFIIIAFVSKYCLLVWLSLHPEAHHAAQFGALFGVITGLVDGVFWGGTLNLFFSWRKLSPHVRGA